MQEQVPGFFSLRSSCCVTFVHIARFVLDKHGPRITAAGANMRVHAFSSFFNSFRNRQSVPWAMIFCGVDLIIPASCWRRA